MTLDQISTPEVRTSLLTQTLSDELRIPGDRLHSFLRLQDDLFLDCTDVNLLIASLESKLEYYLTEEELDQIETVGDIRRLFLR